jgi:hypothetical protein
LPDDPDDLLITVSDGVLSQRVVDEVVLLDSAREVYFGLDEVGAAFWELLQDHRRLSEIHRTLARRYDVSPERLWADLEALVRELEAHALVRAEPVRPGGA